jgi:hypothetical protein
MIIHSIKPYSSGSLTWAHLANILKTSLGKRYYNGRKEQYAEIKKGRR